jgi:hypothetical protein
LDVWCLAFTPINISELNKLTQLYPNQEDAHILYTGFFEGFRLNYCGPRSRTDSKNLQSVIQNPEIAWEKVMNEIYCGRISGPFLTRPIFNLRCSPIGIVPKKTGGFRLITHLSFPPNFSVNDYVDKKFTSVKYSSFDNAINMIKNLGVNALIGKKDSNQLFDCCQYILTILIYWALNLVHIFLLTNVYLWVIRNRALCLKYFQLSFSG